MKFCSEQRISRQKDKLNGGVQVMSWKVKYNELCR